MKKALSILLVLVMILGLVACGAGEPTNDNQAQTPDAGEATGEYKIAIVPKMTSIAWFERMEVGINEYNQAHGTSYYYGGSSEGAGQAAYVESLLAQDFDAICVVPFDTEALEPILQKAREQGIVVITHEAASMTNIDFDIEAFDNEDYGRHFMEQIAEATGGKGEYIQFVGATTSASHMQWVGAAQELQEAQYPEMKQVGLLESADDQDQAYNKAKEALLANPNIVAVQGSAMGDVAGVARAVEELGLTGKVAVIGTSLVSVSDKYIKSGAIQSIGFWDPALAGQAMIELAIAALEGKAADGLALGVAGYENLKLVDKVFYASAWIDVNLDSVDDPAFAF